MILAPRSLTVYDNALYFMAEDSTYGMELWKSDGTLGTIMVKDINPEVVIVGAHN